MADPYTAPATPVAKPTAGDPAAAEQAAADELYDSLKPMADTAGRDYMVARIPPAQMPLVQAKLDADFPPPPEAAPTA